MTIFLVKHLFDVVRVVAEVYERANGKHSKFVTMGFSRSDEGFDHLNKWGFIFVVLELDGF